MKNDSDGPEQDPLARQQQLLVPQLQGDPQAWATMASESHQEALVFAT